MSLELSPGNATRTNLNIHSEQSLDLTRNMLTVVAQSNHPLQKEIQKTAETIDSFMEQMKQNFAALSQENALLKTELLREKTQNQESQQAHQTQIQALNQLVNVLKDRIAVVEKSQHQLELNYLKPPPAPITYTKSNILKVRKHPKIHK